MNKQPKNFYVFRHGECPFNITDHLQGQKFDGSLTPQGCRQAESIGRRLSGKSIEVIVSSPMRRARQTAQIADRWLHVPILIDRRLIEVNMGVAEGMHISSVEKNFSTLYQRWRNADPSDTTTRFKDGETKAEVRRRIFEALNYYALQTPYRNIAVSGHGITLSQILITLGTRRTDIPNGAIIHLTHDDRWIFNNFVE